MGISADYSKKPIIVPCGPLHSVIKAHFCPKEGILIPSHAVDHFWVEFAIISEVACWISSLCLVLVQIPACEFIYAAMGDAARALGLQNSVAARLTQSPIAAGGFPESFKEKG